VLLVLVAAFAAGQTASGSFTLPDGRVLTYKVNNNGTWTYAVGSDSITVDPNDPNIYNKLTEWANRLFGFSLSPETVAESRTYHEQVAGTYRSATRALTGYYTQQRLASSEQNSGSESGDAEVSTSANYLSADSRLERYSSDTDTDGGLSGITSLGYTWTRAPQEMNGRVESRFIGVNGGLSGLRDDVPTGIQTTVLGVAWGFTRYQGNSPGMIRGSSFFLTMGQDTLLNELRTLNSNFLTSWTIRAVAGGRQWGTVTLPIAYNVFTVLYSNNTGTMATFTLDSPFVADLYYPIGPAGMEAFWSSMLSMRWVENTNVSTTGGYSESTGAEALGFGAYVADLGIRYRYNQRVGLQAAFTVGAYPGSVTSIGFGVGLVY
jgi:hypothetical protein